jgi:signal transduction histidine kinase
MRVKSKITLGLVFLFTVIVVLGIIAINYLSSLTVNNQRILAENYKGVENIHLLSDALREMVAAYEPKSQSNVSLDRVEYRANMAVEDFEDALRNQKLNNTDRAQEEILTDIEMEFAALKQVALITRTKDYYFDRLLPLAESISLKINQIFLLNQRIIVSRNERAKLTAENVIYTVAVIVVFCVLVAFSFMVSFPRYIAEPVEIMTSTIDQMEVGDYSKRIEFESKDEFGVMAQAFNKLFDRLEEYEKLNLKKIVVEKKRIDTLIKKLNEGIIGLDSEFNFIFMNPFAKEVLGLGRQRVKGRSAAEVALQFPLFSNLLDDLVEWQETGKRFTRNKLIKGELDGKPMYFIRKVIVTYGGEEDELNGYLLMLKNVTEYKVQDEARRNFIATVSHELKTPIAAIKLSIKLLRDERLSVLTEDQDELVESIESEINRLLNISQELLNANELEEGKIKLYPELCEVHEIVDEAVDSVWTLAEDKDIHILEQLSNKKEQLFVDFDKITWILVNFLTNAVKYSRSHTEVAIRVRSEGDQVHFEVSDQGKGIAPDDLDKIFQRYYRVPGSKEKGTGLGLSISKEIVEQMGGRITVESELEKGSTFRVSLPKNEPKEG